MPSSASPPPSTPSARAATGSAPPSDPPPPRRRLRTRLALLHAAFAFAWCVVLLAVVDLPLFTASHTAPGPASGPAFGAPARTTGNLPEVLRYSAVALVVLGALSLGFGWLIAGRALRPLRTITVAARTMSAEDLDHRLRVPAAYREFAELTATLEGLRQRLHASFTAQRQFIANASHELRTPLTVQRTLLELALADPSPAALRPACQELLDLSRHQESLIDALLTLAGGHRGISHAEEFDLAALVQKVLLDHRAEASRRGLRIDTALAPATATGDPRLAASLVTNLVGNALRHNIPGGTVEIATTPHGRLTVANTGTPIAPAEIDRLFQPFQRLGTDRTDQSEGHGLGLAIVAAIAAAHRARVTAQPRPAGGLTVTVDFPPAP